MRSVHKNEKKDGIRPDVVGLETVALRKTKLSKLEILFASDLDG